MTLTNSLATRSMEAGGARVFTSLTVEARATEASTCGGLTAAIVLTETLQEAGSTIAPSRAGVLAVRPHPAQGAGTAAVGSMTQAPIPAGTLEFTALAKPVLGTAMLTADPRLPGRTDASPRHRVACRPLPAYTHVGTAGAKATLWTGKAAVGPKEPSRTVAGSRGWVAGPTIETLTNVFTARPIAPRWASLQTAGAMVTSGTRADP